MLRGSDAEVFCQRVLNRRVVQGALLYSKHWSVVCTASPLVCLRSETRDLIERMIEKLIPATQLAEYVYCSHAWYLKRHSIEASEETRAIQAEAHAWHEQQGRSLATGDSCRWAACAALLLVALLFFFVWLGWAR